jgi:hypothetical protein
MAVKTISKVGFTPCVAGPREAAGSDPPAIADEQGDGGGN